MEFIVDFAGQGIFLPSFQIKVSLWIWIRLYCILL